LNEGRSETEVLCFAFGFEPFALAVPGYLKRFTIAFYTQGLVPEAMPQESLISLLQSFFHETVSPLEGVLTLLVITGLSLALAARAVERREYVLEQ